MSTQQVRTCIKDLLGAKNKSEVDWQEPNVKRLVSTTTTLYNVSAGKVMLKSSEELARCHICALIACEKLVEKYDEGLVYTTDKIPLPPDQVTKLVGIFKRNIWPNSPLKDDTGREVRFESGRSPSMRNSVVKNARFTGIDPKTLQEQLFETPTKSRKRKAKSIEPLTQFDLSPTKGDQRSTTRRKLTFETESENTIDDKSSLPLPLLATPQNKSALINVRDVFGSTADFDPMSPTKQSPSHSTYLAYPTQLVCGLILLSAFVVFNHQRSQDPTIDIKLMKKMAAHMRTGNNEDIMEAIKITKELIDGEKWYRDLRVQHDYYDGSDFSNAIAIRVGNMLQEEYEAVSEEQYANWKRKIMVDLSLRDGGSL
ncbi:hypothetical protein C6P41_003379 [Kluyveromyces marxianus]|nr:hypothetical protein C6P43_000997 [Kluyveromyces marxianus]KAG0682975.1 hypothetical protein C6P41_003379 [Kluyveromyces marxianus]